MIALATHNAILTKLGYTYKINHISAATYHRLLNLVPIECMTHVFYPIVRDANLICKFMNIYENLKNKGK